MAFKNILDYLSTKEHPTVYRIDDLFQIFDLCSNENETLQHYENAVLGMVSHHRYGYSNYKLTPSILLKYVFSLHRFSSVTDIAWVSMYDAQEDDDASYAGKIVASTYITFDPHDGVLTTQLRYTEPANEKIMQPEERQKIDRNQVTRIEGYVSPETSPRLFGVSHFLDDVLYATSDSDQTYNYYAECVDNLFARYVNCFIDDLPTGVLDKFLFSIQRDNAATVGNRLIFRLYDSALPNAPSPEELAAYKKPYDYVPYVLAEECYLTYDPITGLLRKPPAPKISDVIDGVIVKPVEESDTPVVLPSRWHATEAFKAMIEFGLSLNFRGATLHWEDLTLILPGETLERHTRGYVREEGKETPRRDIRFCQRVNDSELQMALVHTYYVYDKTNISPLRQKSDVQYTQTVNGSDMSEIVPQIFAYLLYGTVPSKVYNDPLYTGSR